MEVAAVPAIAWGRWGRLSASYNRFQLLVISLSLSLFGIAFALNKNHSMLIQLLPSRILGKTNGVLCFTLIFSDFSMFETKKTKK